MAGADFPGHDDPDCRLESRRLLPAASSFLRLQVRSWRRAVRMSPGVFAVHPGALGAGREAAARLSIGKEGASWERKAASAHPEGSGCLDLRGREGPGPRKTRESARGCVCVLPMQTCRPARGRPACVARQERKEHENQWLSWPRGPDHLSPTSVLSPAS